MRKIESYSQFPRRSGHRRDVMLIQLYDKFSIQMPHRNPQLSRKDVRRSECGFVVVLIITCAVTNFVNGSDIVRQRIFG